MNALHSRLAKLRKHAGTTANAMTSVTQEAPAVRTPAIGQRLRQLAAVRRSTDPSRQRVTACDLAEQLGGQLVGEGLIVVEQFLPLGMQHGQYLKLSEQTPLSNLFVTMLNRIGVPSESFADSTGELTDVVA